MATAERRDAPRSHFDILKDLFYGAIRATVRHASGFYTAFGIFVVAGLALAVLLTWGFSEIAEIVRAGTTQKFDTAVLQYMGAHRIHWIQASLLEITSLGTGPVVLMIVIVAGLFLYLTEHRYSTLLLLIATSGGFVLNSVLKSYFSRPRPQVFEWATNAFDTSFPSGHAMNSAIVYGTVAYLAARLQKQRWARALTLFASACVIALICISRMYLGVHYPSDVLAGVTMGLAWAAFCMASLEAVRIFAERFKPRELKHEKDLRTSERAAAGLET
ncbi:MAG: phosphatase PAP2 family protein [Gemmatimonadota bacterium]|nr:phosphatase PAP2 family protein [Gemmatimonadota bacterium]